MDKKQLNRIFSKSFDIEQWQEVLSNVFSVRNLLSKPRAILLNNNDKAKSATELGSFNTFDDRLIGLYHIEVKEDVWLERNKVGLRELLRNVYQYDVDGALVVFEQGNKWRLSLSPK